MTSACQYLATQICHEITSLGKSFNKNSQLGFVLILNKSNLL